ncbi:DoxX family protein [Streptomyces sp. NPDC088246]|uniref:DoxX family protein n=1 Tax=Streptomyces sp. NPDC088246 TaxID=3365842 RepID=UPI00382D472D
MPGPSRPAERAPALPGPGPLPTLATLKAAGAVGLAVGLLDIRAIGAAAAIGLVLFFAGAMAAHFRARVFHNIAFPGAYLAMAIASLGLVITQ